jgi:hypothetical protein
MEKLPTKFGLTPTWFADSAQNKYIIWRMYLYVHMFNSRSVYQISVTFGNGCSHYLLHFLYRTAGQGEERWLIHGLITVIMNGKL